MKHERRVLRGVAALLAGALALLGQPAGAGADVVDDLAPGTWMRVPDSTIVAVMPDPLPPGSSGARGLLAWSSAALDPSGEQLLVTGGGHNDYGGNEVYAFSLRELRWQRLWGPSDAVPGVGWTECAETYADGTPVSRHTYDGLEFVERLGVMYVFSGGLYCSGGRRGTWTWTFDPRTLAWQRHEDVPEGPSEGFTFACDDDPEAPVVYCATTKRVLRHDLEAGTFEQVASLGGGIWDDRTTAVLDPVRKLLVMLTANRVVSVDLESGEVRDPQPTEGGEAVLSSSIRGFDWDPNLGRLVAWAGGATVYSLDTESWQWFAHDPAPSNTVEPSVDEVASTGLYGRFRYVPSRNVYVLVPHVDTDVYLYRLSEGTGSPVPPPPPPAGGDGGPGTPDAGRVDAGGRVAADGGSGDASADAVGDGGCGCAVAAGSRTGAALPWLLALGWLATRRRARR